MRSNGRGAEVEDGLDEKWRKEAADKERRGIMELRMENVTKRLGAFQLGEIDIELPKGYICGLIGENGAGKTTLLRILSGLYRADQGDLYFDGKEYGAHEAEIREDVGVLLHDELLLGRETLLKSARYYGKFYRNYDDALMAELLERFALDGRKRYGKLSKGEKLKFALAFALAHHPRLLLLDEPTANFDKEFREEFQKLLREYVADGENTVILSTHVTSDVDQFADYLLFLHKGRQAVFGDIEQVRRRYRMAAGEAYKIWLLKDRVIHMEEGEFGCKALVKNNGREFDPALKVWEPTAAELMYYIVKGGDRG